MPLLIQLSICTATGFQLRHVQCVHLVARQRSRTPPTIRPIHVGQPKEAPPTKYAKAATEYRTRVAERREQHGKGGAAASSARAPPKEEKGGAAASKTGCIRRPSKALVKREKSPSEVRTRGRSSRRSSRPAEKDARLERPETPKNSSHEEFEEAEEGEEETELTPSDGPSPTPERNTLPTPAPTPAERKVVKGSAGTFGAAAASASSGSAARQSLVGHKFHAPHVHLFTQVSIPITLQRPCPAATAHVHL